MLKRQRPATPPIPSLPLLEEPSPLDAMVMEREYKRRRTTSTSITPQDDHLKGRASSPRPAVSQSGNFKEDTEIAVDSQYKSANSILRELHTLHQHRLLFTGALPGHGVPFQSSSVPPSSQSKSDGSSSLEHCKQTQSETESPCQDEQNQVKERYEDTNRLLGLTFLSRRKQLGLDEQYPE
ncbi:hypothetical protein JOM56_005863 [Amanita muscaria]